MTQQIYRVIDLFCGAGGLSLGFESSGRFHSVFAVDSDPTAARTYAENFALEYAPAVREGCVHNGDIAGISELSIDADVVIGGPPCQGFSPLGHMSRRQDRPELNQMWQHYMRLVHRVRPLAFVIENVPELLKSREYLALLTVAEGLGYTVRGQVLRAVEFGVPQRRVRAFIIGLLGGVTPCFPQDHGSRSTIRDAIGDLPLQPTTMEIQEVAGRQRGLRRQNLHIGRSPTPMSLERYHLIEPGENRFALARKAPHLTPRCWLEKRTGSTDVFGRLQWNDVAYTIRTEFFKPEKGCYLHPEAHRPITHREAARLQTFPDWFYFHGSKIEVARQIGNAVPPRLAEAMANVVASQLPLVRNSLDQVGPPPVVADFGALLTDALAQAGLSEARLTVNR